MNILCLGSVLFILFVCCMLSKLLILLLHSNFQVPFPTSMFISNCMPIFLLLGVPLNSFHDIGDIVCLWSQDPLHLCPSPFREIINDGGTHLVVGPTSYFFCVSLSKWHLPFIFINGEDPYSCL